MKKIFSVFAVLVFVISFLGMVAADGTNGTGDGNDTAPISLRCIKNDVACCLGDVCVTTTSQLLPGYACKITGCDITCKPKVECTLSNLTTNDCQDKYWFDNDNTDCGLKKFCGAYMYEGLHTFDTKNACFEKLNTTTSIVTPDDNTNSNSSSNDTNSNTNSFDKPNGRIPCEIDQNLYLQMIDLNKQLTDANQDTLPELKTKMIELTQKIKDQRNACKPDATNTPAFTSSSDSSINRQSTTSIDSQGSVPPAIGIFCAISDENKNAQNDAWDAYKKALESKDDATISTAKMKIQSLEDKINSDRDACMSQRIPGKEKGEECKVPQELYVQLKDAWKNNAGNDMQEQIADIESKIKSYTQLCNAPSISSDAKPSDIVSYYKGKMINVMASSETSDNKIASLKDLRQEIDNTIANLIGQRKNIKFDDVKGMVDSVTVGANSISIGESKTDGTDVSIESYIGDSSVSVAPTTSGAEINQDGIKVDSVSVAVDKDGINVDGANVSVSPKELMQRHKLLSNMARVTALKLSKENNKAMYTANVDAKKNILGFIPATTNEEIKVDAENGNIISESKPWWSAISTDVVN